jgi:hypothetical protein
MTIQKRLCASKPLHEELIDIVLSDSENIPRRWEDWCKSIEIQVLEPGIYELLPLVYMRIRKLVPSDPLINTLRGIYKRNWTKNMLIFRQLEQVVEAFSDANIDALVLKGMSLVPYYEMELGARMMDDSDLLVPESKVNQAAKILVAMGWRTDPGVSLQTLSIQIIPLHHAWCFRQNNVRLDLHWQPVHREYGDIDDGCLWKNSTEQKVRSQNLRVPEPASTLLFALVHGLRPQGNRKVTWIVDAVKIIKSLTPGDSVRFRELCRNKYFSVLVTDSLGYLSERFGVDVMALLPEPARFTRLQAMEYALLIDSRPRKVTRIVIRTLLGALRTQTNQLNGKLVGYWLRGIYRNISIFRRYIVESMARRLLRYELLSRLQLKLAPNWLLPENPDWKIQPTLSNAEVHFTAKTNAHLHAISNWALQEENFIWSDGFLPRLVFAVDCLSNGYLRVELDFDSYKIMPENFVLYDVFLNKKFIDRWSKTGAVQTSRHTVFVSIKSGERKLIDLQLRALHANYPCHYEQSADHRLLGMCLRKVLFKEIEEWNGQDSIYFLAGGKSTQYLGNGWWPPEEKGVWSGEKQCSIFVPLVTDAQKNFELRIYLNLRQEQNYLKITVSGKYIGSYESDSAIDSPYIAVALMESDRNQDYITISFSNHSLQSPYDIGESSDKRPLGFMLHQIQWL